MSHAFPRLAVTPPAFCRSKILRTELTRFFPHSTFNTKDRYLSEDELIDFLQEAQGALIGRDPVTERVLRAHPQLRVISKYGVGLDNIDPEALEGHPVHVRWTPGVNRRSVAELTLGFMIALFHNLGSTVPALREGHWLKDGGAQLTGKTVGIVGCGRVGEEVVRLLAPFECRILIRDIVDKSKFCLETGASEVSFEELIETADLVSLHVPLTPLTRNLVDEITLHRMKPAAYLVNTARGEVVDPEALKRALQQGRIAGAALDVFAGEPPEDRELLALPNLLATPHIGGNTVEAVEAMGRAAIDHLVQFFQSTREPEAG